MENSRIDPRGPGLTKTTTVLLFVIAVTAFVLGTPAIVWAGRLAGLGHLAWGVPIIVDGALVVLAITAVVRRAHEEPALWMWTAVAVYTLLSAGVQVGHVASETPAVGAVQVIIAIIIGALLPITVLVITHAWLDIAVGAPQKRKGRAGTSAVSPAKSRTKSASQAITAPQVAPAALAKPTPEVHQKPVQPAQSALANRTAIDTAEVLLLAEQGLPQREIAERVGSSKSTVARVINSAKAEQEVAA